jgi:hypothetical protein
MPHYSWQRSRPSSGSSESPAPSILKTGNRSSGSSIENCSGCSSSDNNEGVHSNKQTSKQTSKQSSDNKRLPSPAFIQTQQPQHTVVNLTKIKIYCVSVLMIVTLNLILMYFIF